MSTTLPSASTLTDEQLRVLAAEANGWTKTGHTAFGWENKTTDKIAEDVYELPDPLHDANAAKELLNRHGQWEVSRDEGLVIGISVTIYKPDKAFVCTRPDFCRAVVIAVLRAEGKIL